MGNINSMDACPEFIATTEMVCVISLALWSIPMNHIPAVSRTKKFGLPWALGNRDRDREKELSIYDKDLAEFVGRADRAKANHHDNLPMITAVILAVVFMGRTDDFTGNASMVVLVSRIIHSITYLCGITGIRSLAYFTSIGALIAIVMRAWALPSATWC